MDDPLAGFESETDSALREVKQELLRLDPDGTRWASVIRQTYDMIYNGQHTGRYRWDQLMKTEKTHFGTLFEINAQREFEFAGGESTDYSIAGHQVDAKWSQSMWKWMLPPEIFSEIALVATGDDQRASWSLGLVRVTADHRKEASNRDKKSQLSLRGRAAVDWIWQNEGLRPNILLQLPYPAVDKIFSHRHGTERTNELFRAAEGMIVNRNAVATVSRQLDAQKRVRYNGGARSALAPEGFLILSGNYHRQLAFQLGLPKILPDEYISVRVVRCGAEENSAHLDGHLWRRALDYEPSPRAPLLREHS